MKGSHKFWLAVSLAVLVRVVIFIAIYYYDNWSTNEMLRERTFGLLAIYAVVASCVLIAAWAWVDEGWSENDVKPACFLAPLFYIWMLVYYINKLTDKYLT